MVRNGWCSAIAGGNPGASFVAVGVFIRSQNRETATVVLRGEADDE